MKTLWPSEISKNKVDGAVKSKIICAKLIISEHTTRHNPASLVVRQIPTAETAQHRPKQIAFANRNYTSSTCPSQSDSKIPCVPLSSGYRFYDNAKKKREEKTTTWPWAGGSRSIHFKLLESCCAMSWKVKFTLSITWLAQWTLSRKVISSARRILINWSSDCNKNGGRGKKYRERNIAIVVMNERCGLAGMIDV